MNMKNVLTAVSITFPIASSDEGPQVQDSKFAALEDDQIFAEADGQVDKYTLAFFNAHDEGPVLVC